MTTTSSLPDECIHGLVGGCVTCEGTDPMRDIKTRQGATFEQPWSDEELSFVDNPNLTSGQVAGMTGRPSKTIAAYRNKRGMTEWAGNKHTLFNR